MPDVTLQDLREHTGRSAADVAAQIGVHRMSVTRWERGERLPGPAQLRALAAALDVETATLAAVFDRVRVDTRHSGAAGDRLHTPGLRRTRLRYGTPVRAVALLLNVPTSTVYNWEATRAGMPRHHLATLAHAWGCDVGTLHAALRTPPAPARRRVSRLRRLRLRRGLSQSQVARCLQVSRYSVARWEAGGRPPLHAVRALARLYGHPTTTIAAAAGVTPPRLLSPRLWRPGDLPAVLLTLREWSGLTQAEVARHCRCSRDAVRGWERGRATPHPSRRTALEALYRLPHGALLASYPENRD